MNEVQSQEKSIFGCLSSVLLQRKKSLNIIDWNRFRKQKKNNNNNNYNINLCTAIVYKGDFIYREQIDYTKC